MPLATSKYQHIVEYLLYAERDVHEAIQITKEHPELTVDDAYYIQRALVNQRLQENNTRTIGLKLGLTNEVKRKELGVSELIFGHLHEDMLAKEWEPIRRSELIHPKVEPELAFFIGKDIAGDEITVEEIVHAIDYVAPALEIIDSRYKDFEFSLIDVVSDNCSCAKFVVGSKLVKLHPIDLNNIGVAVSKNGMVEKTGSSSALSRNPLKVLIHALKSLHVHNKGFHKGDIVLSGALCEAIPIDHHDTIVAEFDTLGTVTATFV